MATQGSERHFYYLYVIVGNKHESGSTDIQGVDSTMLAMEELHLYSILSTGWKVVHGMEAMDLWCAES